MEIKHILADGFFMLGHLDEVVSECRVMASNLDLTIRWKIRQRTAIAFLKWNTKHTLWKAEFKHDNPHRMICLMYAGIHAELIKRTEENRIAKIRIAAEEKEREAERQIMEMKPWKRR